MVDAKLAVLRSELAADHQRRLNAMEGEWRQRNRKAAADVEALHAAKMREVGSGFSDNDKIVFSIFFYIFKIAAAARH
jgi:hypothetical protein